MQRSAGRGPIVRWALILALPFFACECDVDRSDCDPMNQPVCSNFCSRRLLPTCASDGTWVCPSSLTLDCLDAGVRPDCGKGEAICACGVAAVGPGWTCSSPPSACEQASFGSAFDPTDGSCGPVSTVCLVDASGIQCCGSAYLDTCLNADAQLSFDAPAE